MFVQSLWIGPKLSAMERLCINSFLKNGISFHLYTYEQIRNIPVGTTVLDGNEIIPSSEITRFRYNRSADKTAFSDAFRYKLLLEKGGIWVDMDVACLRPFTIAEPYSFQIGSNRDGTTYYENALIKAPPNSPLMWSCYEYVLSLRDQTVRWGAYGPDLLKEKVLALGLERFARTDMFLPIWWEETELFCAISLKARWRWLWSRAYVVHLCNEMWRLNDRDKDKHYPGSIYGLLRKRYL